MGGYASAGQTTESNPLGYGSTVGTTSGPVLPANPTRGGLIFHNPSTTVSVAICPASVGLGPNNTASPTWPQTTGVAVINGAGSVTLAPGDKFIIDTLQATSAFNGIASQSGGILTIWEF